MKKGHYCVGHDPERPGQVKDPVRAIARRYGERDHLRTDIATHLLSIDRRCPYLFVAESDRDYQLRRLAFLAARRRTKGLGFKRPYSVAENRNGAALEAGFGGDTLKILRLIVPPVGEGRRIQDRRALMG